MKCGPTTFQCTCLRVSARSFSASSRCWRICATFAPSCVLMDGTVYFGRVVRGAMVDSPFGSKSCKWIRSVRCPAPGATQRPVPSAVMTAGPLADLVVLDLTRALAGPHAAMMLGDLGARVIKVEPPTGADTRSWGPPFIGEEDERESTYFLSANRNKESLVLDLKDEDDKEVLARLVA